MLILAVILTFLMLVVILMDSSRFIIPNWLVGIVVLLYPVLLYLTPAKLDWPWALGLGVITFFAGFLLYIFKAFGGGDVKLLAACALYAGLPAYLDYIMTVAILGGVLALLLIVMRPMAAYSYSRLSNPPPIPRVLTTGEPVPYGVAIAVAFTYFLWMGKLPGFAL